MYEVSIICFKEYVDKKRSTFDFNWNVDWLLKNTSSIFWNETCINNLLSSCRKRTKLSEVVSKNRKKNIENTITERNKKEILTKHFVKQNFKILKLSNMLKRKQIRKRKANYYDEFSCIGKFRWKVDSVACLILKKKRLSIFYKKTFGSITLLQYQVIVQKIRPQGFDLAVK